MSKIHPAVIPDEPTEVLHAQRGTITLHSPSRPTSVLAGVDVGEARFENAIMDWTVESDEYVYVIAGYLRVRTNETTVELAPTDSLFLARGTEVTYEVEGTCSVLYVLATAGGGQ